MKEREADKPLHDRIKEAAEALLDPRPDKAYRAQIDLITLSSELSHKKCELEKEIAQLEISERMLLSEITEKFMGGTGKEREAKAFEDERFRAARYTLREKEAEVKKVHKGIELLESLAETARYRVKALKGA
jgi:hypothetical protein